jgi:hypothetical protein
MEEFVKSIKAFLYDRTTSPLFGAYATAWCCWNYRVIVAVLNGDTGLESKMKFIDDYFGVVTYQIGSNNYYVWGQVIHGILGPILLTLLYLFIYPLLAKPVYEHSLGKQKELREIKQSIENQRLLTVEESRKIMTEIEQVRYKAEKDVQERDDRIRVLVETVNALETKQLSVAVASTTEPAKLASNISFSLEDFSEQVQGRVAERPDGEFQLSQLFSKDDWKSLSLRSKNERGKLFRQMVERGDFVNVSLLKKGSGNQLIYLKKSASSSNELPKFEDMLTQKYSKDFSKSKDLPIDLIKKIATYFVNNNIGEEMYEVIYSMAYLERDIATSEFYEGFSPSLSQIEVDHILKKLKDKGIIGIGDFGKNRLSDKGKEIAVESGLTSFIKRLKKNRGE